MLNGTRPRFDTNGPISDWHPPRVDYSPYLGPFASTASLLLQAGYSPVPIEPGDKRPLAALGGWDRLRSAPLTIDEIAAIEARHPSTGVGVAGGFNGLVPVDFDTENEEIVAAAKSVLPESLVDKRGRRGVTSFYYDPVGSIRARKFKDAQGIMMIEVLTTGQTVIPPTRHPETDRPYTWVTDCTLLDVQVRELPELPPDTIERLESALRPWLPPPRQAGSFNAGGGKSVPDKRIRAYAEAALEAEVRSLGAASRGGRNQQLFVASCRLGRYVHHGVLREDEMAAALLEAASTNGLAADDGRRACERTIASGLRKAEGDELPVLDDRSSIGARAQANDSPGRSARDGASRRTQAQDLIEIATADDVELFHSPDGTTYADILVNGHRETWSTKSSGFRRWLRRAYYEKTEGAPNGESMSTALALIEAHAQFDGAKRNVYLRVAPHNETIYIDLGDDAWRAIEIDSDGWRIVNSPPVRFRRTPGMLPLPTPLLGGKIEELQKHLNLTKEAFVLSVGWLLQVFRGRGPYPTLALNGEQGAGKTTAAHRLRGLVDPHAAPLRALPRDVRDLAIAANNAHVLCVRQSVRHSSRCI